MSRVWGITTKDAVAISKMIIDEDLAKHYADVSRHWWRRSKHYVCDMKRGSVDTVSHFAVSDLKAQLDSWAVDVPLVRERIQKVRAKVREAEEVGRFLWRQ